MAEAARGEEPPRLRIAPVHDQPAQPAALFKARRVVRFGEGEEALGIERFVLFHDGAHELSDVARREERSARAAHAPHAEHVRVVEAHGADLAAGVAHGGVRLVHGDGKAAARHVKRRFQARLEQSVHGLPIQLFDDEAQKVHAVAGIGVIAAGRKGQRRGEYTFGDGVRAARAHILRQRYAHDAGGVGEQLLHGDALFILRYMGEEIVQRAVQPQLSRADGLKDERAGVQHLAAAGHVEQRVLVRVFGIERCLVAAQADPHGECVKRLLFQLARHESARALEPHALLSSTRPPSML